MRSIKGSDTVGCKCMNSLHSGLFNFIFNSALKTNEIGQFWETCVLVESY